MEETLKMALVAGGFILVFIIPIYILNIRIKGNRANLLTKRFKELCGLNHTAITHPHVLGTHIFGYNDADGILISLKINNEIESVQVIQAKELQNAEVLETEANGSVSEIKLNYRTSSGKPYQLLFYKQYQDNEGKLRHIRKVVNEIGSKLKSQIQ